MAPRPNPKRSASPVSQLATELQKAFNHNSLPHESYSYLARLLTLLNEACRPHLPATAVAACLRDIIGPSLNVLNFNYLSGLRGPLAEKICKAKLSSPGAGSSTASTSRRPQRRTGKMSTPTVDQFLSEISRILREKNAAQLQDYLIVEPNPEYSDLYKRMIQELRGAFPKSREGDLEAKCSQAIPEAREGQDGMSWTAFIKFMVQYFCFLRDVDISNLLDTYNLLSELVQKSNSALGHATLGVLILPTVVVYSRILARLAIGLDKKPELIAHLTNQSSDEGARETLPERAANIMRNAFVICLNDRTPRRNFKPDGKKEGIYKLANLCLKVLFQCRKTRNAKEIFMNIFNQSPPLSIYPRAEQVTYLYYLGRFHFSNSHFYRAQFALQAAYDNCPKRYPGQQNERQDGKVKQPNKQRRLILIYLIACNMTLGRFPSQQLYQRPEAAGLAEKFHPICEAIAGGNLAAFRKLLDLDHPNANWFMHFRILLQLRNRCEILVYRSLMRKTFLINGTGGDMESRKAPTLNLDDVLKLTRFLELKAMTEESPPDSKPGQRHTNWVFMENKAPAPEGYVDPDLWDPDSDSPEPLLPDMLEIECIVASLIDQGLLGGFISHSQLKFAIQGAKRHGGPLRAGFPNIWNTISGRLNDEVPGWTGRKKDSRGFDMQNGADAFGPGQVVRLQGARPAGMAP